MHFGDYLILSGYVLVTLGVGLVFARRQTGDREFFLAGRSMHWLPVGLSVMVTAFSAVNYTAFAGEVFANGLYVTLSLPIFLLVIWPVTRYFIPFYHRMELCSVYEYLEIRFDVRVRCLASALFIFWRALWTATALFVPCKVLSVLTGLDTRLLVLIVGAAATVYTVAGGMRAVMWTDVLQFFILFGGLIFGVVWVALRGPGGFGGMLRMALEGEQLAPFAPFDASVLSFDPRIRITVWSCWIGTFVAFLARYGADQSVVQRYFTARSLATAQKGFILNAVCAVGALLCLALFGIAMRAHAVSAGLLDGGISRPPLFYFAAFLKSFPFGISGLMIAGLLAATMSTVDSCINSCTAAYITDFHNRFSGIGATGRGLAAPRRDRLFAVLFGAVGITLAMFVGRFGSIFEIANRIINGFGSPLLALFLLGMFSNRVNAHGMLTGGILGAVMSGFISVTVQNLALHYYAVLNLLVTAALCYFFSFLFGGSQRDTGPGAGVS